VETRAATKKYQKVEAGDVLVFVCGKERFEKRIKQMRHFRTITAMLRVHKVKDIAPDLTTAKELRATYDGYPGYREKIKKFGVVAFAFS